MTDSSKEEDNLQREAAILKGTVADAIFAWAEVEEALCSLLSDVLAIRDRAYGPAIYYAISAAELRISIVDAAVQHWLLGGRPYGDHITGAWLKIVDQLNACRKTRNKIAHGEMRRWTIRTKTKMRLTGSVFQTQSRPGQFPGMSSNDVKLAVAKFRFYATAAKRFAYSIQTAQADPLDTQELHEAVAQLRDHLRKAPAQSGVQTPPRPSILPESSPR